MTDQLGLDAGCLLAAAAAHRVERIKVKLVHDALRLDDRLIKITVVRMQGSATTLITRGDDLTPVGEQDLHGVPIHFGKGQILHTAGEQADTVARLRFGRLHGRDECI